MKEKKEKLSIKKQLIINVIFLIIKIGIIIGIFYLIFHYIFGVMRVQDELMIPSIREGDFVIYYRLDKKYQVGEAVAVKIGDEVKLFRIAGLPDDIIKVDEDGDRLLINDAPEEHISFFKTIVEEGEITYPYQVPKDSYFLVNDYRMNTEDSRKYGAISKKQILGKVIGKLQSRNI